MSGRAHQFDVFRIIQEILDGEITGIPVVDLLRESDIRDGFVTSQ